MGYASERDFDEGLAWEVHGKVCKIHNIHYRSDLGACPHCENGIEPEEELDPRGFPGDD